MINLEEIEQIATKITLTLDNPTSVKRQIKQINLAQQQLKIIKREINQAIKEINQDNQGYEQIKMVSLGLNILGNRKIGRLLRHGSKEVMQMRKHANREPYLELRNTIDDLINQGDRLKIQAQQYLLSS